MWSSLSRRIITALATAPALAAAKNLATAPVLAAVMVLGAALALDPGQARAESGLEEKIVSQTFLNRVQALKDEERTRVIVLLRDYQIQVGVELDEGPERDKLRKKVSALQAEVMVQLDPATVEPKNRFGLIPGFSASVTRQGLRQLAAMDNVALIEEDKKVYPETYEGLSLISPGPFRRSHGGQGLSVAVVDTGINYLHPALGGAPLGANTKVLGGYDVGDNDPDPSDCYGHGTNCAGIVAGLNTGTGSYVGGVAPEAKLYALKITSGCNSHSYVSNIVAAWDWAVAHRNDNPDYPIKIISTSFGYGKFAAPCDDSSPSLAAAAANAVANGILIFVSSGNSGQPGAISSPGCLRDTISVGAVWDADFANYNRDQVTYYSNSAYFLDLLAPSHNAYTPNWDGGYRTDFGGTSAACPYAAGSAALIQSWAKSSSGDFLTPSEVVNILATSGDPITDPKSAITKPRIHVEQAAVRSAPALIPRLEGPDYGSTVDEGTVSLSWGPVEGASRYWVALRGSEADSWFEGGAGGQGWLSETSVIISGLKPGQTYYWMVMAADDLDNRSAWSEQWSFTVDYGPGRRDVDTFTPPAPAAPRGIPFGQLERLAKVAAPAGPRAKTLINSLGMKFTSLPAGSFIMGSPDQSGGLDEFPRGKVGLGRSYMISVHEVTQAQWQAIMGSNPSTLKGSDHPVESVSWHEVQEFIGRLNAREGTRTYRLPTEAEWEYACRAGSQAKWPFGDSGEIYGDHAWYWANSKGRLHQPVGLKEPNRFGLYDMLGNVEEWVQDWYAEGYYLERAAKDPRGPETGRLKVSRGGSTHPSPYVARASTRSKAEPGQAKPYRGFRLVKEL